MFLLFCFPGAAGMHYCDLLSPYRDQPPNSSNLSQPIPIRPKLFKSIPTRSKPTLSNPSHLIPNQPIISNPFQSVQTHPIAYKSVPTHLKRSHLFKSIPNCSKPSQRVFTHVPTNQKPAHLFKSIPPRANQSQPIPIRPTCSNPYQPVQNHPNPFKSVHSPSQSISTILNPCLNPSQPA